MDRFFPYKLLAHADRLKQIGAGQVPYPVDWHIYPSNYCNHSCEWCMFRQPLVGEAVPEEAKGDLKKLAVYGEQQKYAATLPRGLLLRAVEAAARTGAVLTHFSGGGEPLLNKHTVDAMDLARRRGLKVALSTNGTLLTPKVAEVCDYIRVSLNAGTAEQHYKTNHVEGEPATWERIIDNIRSVMAWRLVHNGRSRLADVGLAFVLDHHNWQDVYPFCRLGAELGVSFVHIRPAFYFDKDADAEVRDTMPQALVECDRARADFGDRVAIYALTSSFEGFWTPRSYNRCRAVWTGVVLTATGDFAVCQDRTDLRFGQGYKSGESFESIWHSAEHRSLVESIASPGTLDQCPRCVWNRRNELIEAVVDDRIRLDLV